MVKAFKLIPFDYKKEEIPIKESLFYVDVESRNDYWKDVVIISSSNLEEITDVSKNLQSLKNDPRFKDKFIILNHYNTEEEKIHYYVLEELHGEIK